MEIRAAVPEQARTIARLIMEAMNYECCQYFAGPRHTLQDFEDAMTRLVERTDSQYSYCNTLVAMAPGGEVAGALVCYDGARLYELREAFLQEARESFQNTDFVLDDETQAGELYLDSLCVAAPFRHQGIATQLLRAGMARAAELGIPQVGLLVDAGNPSAERLYTSLGFRFANKAMWGSHAMKHLTLTINN